MTQGIRGFSVLERTSGFVLEVLPYLLSALIAAVVLPGLLYTQAHEPKAVVAPYGPRLGMIHWDHAVLSSDINKAAGDMVAYR